MRAKEFVINIPINIRLNGDGDPEISTGDADMSDDDNMHISPLQQELELKKAEQGKSSLAIDQITKDEDDTGM